VASVIGIEASLRISKLILLLGVILLSVLLPTTRVYAITVGVTPGSQVVSEFSTALYSISLGAPNYPNPPNPDTYLLTLSGLPSGSVFAFGTNPVPVPAGGATVPLTIDVASSGLCPGTYALSVTATKQGPTPPGPPFDSSSGTFSLTVTPSGPPLSASVSTDKPAYRLNDKITILMNVNKPALARLTITPPSGTPKVFNFILYGASSRTLTADVVGRWSVTMEAAVCSEFSSAVAYFDVSPDTYDVSLSLSGVPPDVSVGIKVDGNPQGTIGGSEIKKLSFKVETQHSISVDQYVPGAAGVRYFCSLNTWNVGSAGSKTFEYETQYQLTVTTDPDGVTQVTGSGWYKSGSPVQIGQVPDTLSGPAGTRYVFKGWKIDGAQQTGNQISVTMDAPHNVVAVYETQYQLIVDSAYGNPQGSGFYAAGSTATFSVTTPVGLIIQQVFVNWDGDFTGTSPTGSMEMTKPARVHANWGTSYFQLYILLAVLGVAIVAIFLLRRRRQGAAPPTTKPTPEMPAETETGEAPFELSSDAAKCSSCGADVPPGQTFCQNCGAKMT